MESTLTGGAFLLFLLAFYLMAFFLLIGTANHFVTSRASYCEKPDIDPAKHFPPRAACRFEAVVPGLEQHLRCHGPAGQTPEHHPVAGGSTVHAGERNGRHGRQHDTDVHADANPKRNTLRVYK